MEGEEDGGFVIVLEDLSVEGEMGVVRPGRWRG
jgi:hypothetical protein